MIRSSLKELWADLSTSGSVPFLYVSTVFIMIGQGVISPVLPLYAREFGIGTAMIGVVVAAFGIARFMVNLPAGFLAERYGRRILLVGGPAIGAVASFLQALAGSFPELVVYRVLYGVGSAMFMTGAMTYIADVSRTGNRARLMGLQSGSIHFGTTLGPAVGGVIAGYWGIRAPFFFLAGLCACSALWAYFRLPETKDWTGGIVGEKGGRSKLAEKVAHGGKSGLAFALSDTTFLLVCLLTLMLFFTRAGSHHTLLPIIGTGSKVGLTVGQLGIAFSIISFINMLMTVPAGILSDSYGRKATIIPGALGYAVSLMLFSFSTSYWSFIAAGILMGLSSGMTNSVQGAYAADLSRGGNFGVTMGLYRTFGDAGFFIGPILLGWIADIAGNESALWANAVLLVLVSLLLAIAGKETVTRNRRGTQG